jgi:hypothetical protein
MAKITIKGDGQYVEGKVLEFDTTGLDLGGGGGGGGDAVLGVTNLTTSYYNTLDASWQDTGLSVTLPEAGDYIVNMNAGGGVVTSADGVNGMQGRLYNVTDSALVPNSTAYFVAGNCVTGVSEFGQINLEVPITVTGETTIRLEAMLSDYTTISVGLVSGEDGSAGGEGVNVSRLKVTKLAS